MSQVLPHLLYTKEHEWVEVINDTRVRVGITDFAQHQLGDIVFVELPAIGSAVSAEAGIGSVESVKTVSDIFSPVSGKVAKINNALESAPEKVNQAPFGDGWMLEVEISGKETLAHLLTAEQYAKLTSED